MGLPKLMDVRGEALRFRIFEQLDQSEEFDKVVRQKMSSFNA